MGHGKPDHGWRKVESELITTDQEIHRIEVPSGWIYVITETIMGPPMQTFQHAVFVPGVRPEDN
jgi:hypothetical protein